MIERPRKLRNQTTYCSIPNIFKQKEYSQNIPSHLYPTIAEGPVISCDRVLALKFKPGPSHAANLLQMRRLADEQANADLINEESSQEQTCKQDKKMDGV